MEEEISKYLYELSQKLPEKRQEALETILKKEAIDVTLQKEMPSERFPKGITNYLFTSERPGSDVFAAATGSKAPGSPLLFCAHYDARPGSFGANDNAAGVCILLALYRAFVHRNIAADFCLFDGEEDGHTGSQLFADLVEEGKQRRPVGAINLDVCGYGDHIVIFGKGSERQAALRPFVNKKLLKAHDAQLVSYLPESDDKILRRNKIPSLSVAIVPYWDVQYLKAMGAQGGGLLGRTPEFAMMESSMEVMSTLHGGFRDDPDWIQPKAMNKVLSYLLAVTSKG